MIEWERDGNILRVVDADNTTLSVRGVDLSIDGPTTELDRPVDETLAVTARALQFPHAIVYADALGRGDHHQFEPTASTLELPADEYVLDIDAEIKTYLRFSGSAVVERAPDFSSIVVTFPEPRRVIIGFRSRHELPVGTVTVPDSPSGVARGLSVLSSSIKTDSPDRTYPTLRGHPPLLEVGSTLEVPADIRESIDRDGVELLVPPTYESLFVVAPLAYYLQASVRTEPGIQPRIQLPAVARYHDLEPMPALEREVERLLKHVFFLDCLVRNAGPYGTKLAEASVLDALEVDADRLYRLCPQERLSRYLDIPYAAIDHRVPEWHLSTYVEPVSENVEALPYLLDRLSLVFRPHTSTLEGKELVERSLDDFYRGPTPVGDRRARHRTHRGRGPDRPLTSGDPGPGVRGAGQVASVTMVKPELRSGRVHGWLAEGVPIDVFKSTPAAYRNRLSFLERNPESTSIRVVLNDPEMDGERERVARIYSQRAEELSLDVHVDEGLTTGELARLFESDHAFVHYIGHCETDGLRCPDGRLSTASIDRCRVETFFLNACGSFYEGLDLVERGSVAGAVTFKKVLNEHALKVGSTFAKLLVHGFSFERAMRLARRRIMMGKDYAVVGDGTHSLTGGDLQLPTTARIDSLGDDRYVLELECYSTRVTGLYYVPHASDNQYSYLCGSPATFTLGRRAVGAFLAQSQLAVIFDGDLYWSTALAARFQSGDGVVDASNA